MRTFLFLTFLISSSFCFAQNNEGNVIILHPSVGKVIDNSEKGRYHLFPEYKDSTFNTAYFLKYNDSTFTVIVTNIQNEALEKGVSQKELDQLYYQIEDISQKLGTLYNEENNNKKKRKPSGPNSANAYIATEFFVQLTIITIDILLALAN